MREAGTITSIHALSDAARTPAVDPAVPLAPLKASSNDGRTLCDFRSMSPKRLQDCLNPGSNWQAIRKPE